jgi:hypothetical protein
LAVVRAVTTAHDKLPVLRSWDEVPVRNPSTKTN